MPGSGHGVAGVGTSANLSAAHPGKIQAFLTG